ncbi:ATP-binding protein [Phenylobacterium sp.]|jgi:signal transduction histidine kinase/ActR/RegA family two-component response regulator|uniref:ATP-binding protein n=1 Tax=Phenylobacterium sp. TaxID=1871053 RepID=UPI002F3EC7CE
MNASPPLRRDRMTVVALIGAIGLILVSLAITIFNESIYRSRRIGSLAAQTAVMAATVEPALVFGDSQAAQEAMSALRANPGIEVAGVYDAAGQQLARYATRHAAPPERAPPPGAVVRRSQAGVAVVVTHEGRAVGTVYLRTAPEPLAAYIGRHAGTALLLLISVLIVAGMRSVQKRLIAASQEAEARALDLTRLNQELRNQEQRRESAEEALRQSQKMETLGQLTGGIAHDFNNLLQSVQGSLELIGRRPNDAARVERLALTGLAAAERGARLTAQLLAFSRSQKLELRALNVAELTARLDRLLPNTVGPGVEIAYDLNDVTVQVTADATQLELAVLNLCINARDAMPDGGRILLRSRLAALEADPELEAGEYLLLSVSDTGAGMSETVRARAFEPFFTTKDLGKGTGLGLAQVYGIAKQAGGTARIDSAPDLGTTVTIYLPRAKTLAAAEEPPAENEPAPVVAGARILVVDDDAGVRAYVTDALAHMGYVTLEAEDGVTALKVLDEQSVDLMLVDYAMPGMTGAEVTRRALAQRPRLPVVFASGYAVSDALEQALGRPARLLRKPFDSRALALSVHDALTGKEPASAA